MKEIPARTAGPEPGARAERGGPSGRSTPLFPEDASAEHEEYRRLLDELDRWPPEGTTSEDRPPPGVAWLPEVHYNAALWETA